MLHTLGSNGSSRELSLEDHTDDDVEAATGAIVVLGPDPASAPPFVAGKVRKIVDALRRCGHSVWADERARHCPAGLAPAIGCPREGHPHRQAPAQQAGVDGHHRGDRRRNQRRHATREGMRGHVGEGYGGQWPLTGDLEEDRAAVLDTLEQLARMTQEGKLDHLLKVEPAE